MPDVAGAGRRVGVRAAIVSAVAARSVTTAATAATSQVVGFTGKSGRRRWASARYPSTPPHYRGVATACCGNAAASD